MYQQLYVFPRENTTFKLQPNDEAIILDISIPEVINHMIPDSQILEIIDHHPGYEVYWHERIGNKAIIEKIGAVATSVFEWWGECWDYNKMSPEIVKLLLAAVLDNTLNFNAKITTSRDHDAANNLAGLIGTTVEKFASWYFAEASKAIMLDLHDSLLQDCKQVVLPIDHSQFTFCQLTLWEAKPILERSEEINRIVNAKDETYLVSILSISERKNYILASSEKLAEYFCKLLRLKEQKPWLKSNQLFLRKEILAKMIMPDQ